MKKETSKLYLIGIFNGIVFTFAFLLFMVGMDEKFHFFDNVDNSEDKYEVDSIIQDLSLCDKEEIEVEYLKRHAPEHILDVLLHQYSMVGTLWEDKWDQLSDMEKIKILLDELSAAEKEMTEEDSYEVIYRDQAELNEIHGNRHLEYRDSVENESQKPDTIEKGDDISWNDSIVVVYRQPVNGYKVKAVVKPGVSDVPVMKADISFEKDGEGFTLPTLCFGDTLFCKGRMDYESENQKIFKKYRNKTIEADYHINVEKDRMTPVYTPFFFMDLDFDGVDELVIVHHSMAVRFHDGYDVYRIVEGMPVLIDYPPYKTHDDFGMTDYPEFDFKKKTISCSYPEGELTSEGRTIYSVSKKQKDTVVVNGRKHYFNHMEVVKEIKFDRDEEY